MDIQLQGSKLNGIQLTRLIRGLATDFVIPGYAQNISVLDIPILFVTAYGSRYSEAELRDAGGSGSFHKPVDFIKIMGSLTRSLVGRVLQSG
jgi:CheY-like chemotaxis protein